MKKHHYPTRDAKRNYFPLPNEIFTLNLTPGEIAVLIINIVKLHGLPFSHIILI